MTSNEQQTVYNYLSSKLKKAKVKLKEDLTEDDKEDLIFRILVIKDLMNEILKENVL